jgi:hypothetical protein
MAKNSHSRLQNNSGNQSSTNLTCIFLRCDFITSFHPSIVLAQSLWDPGIISTQSVSSRDNLPIFTPLPLNTIHEYFSATKFDSHHTPAYLHPLTPAFRPFGVPRFNFPFISRLAGHNGGGTSVLLIAFHEHSQQRNFDHDTRLHVTNLQHRVIRSFGHSASLDFPSF